MRRVFVCAALAAVISSCASVDPDETPEGVGEIANPVCAGASDTDKRALQAQLAGAMARELKRWQALDDLTLATVNGVQQLVLSGTGLARCASNGGCPSTQANLGLQATYAAYRNLLTANYQHQQSIINLLLQTNPSQVPPAHQLHPSTVVVPPSCGLRSAYTVTSPDGSVNINNPTPLRYALYFAGYPNNPYLNFEPAGTGKVSILTCPTYPMDRIYNPDHSLAGSCCVTQRGEVSALIVVPRMPEYLGCPVPN